METEAYEDRLSTFLKTQDYLGNIDLDAFRSARMRAELGITSLAVIMLVVNYMEANGMSNAEFNPDWVSRLDYIEGILSVFREIDLEKTKLLKE
ncbi:hypothetical protein [Archangium lansingense]|uniref:Acyl carrier protein n=1 Tax=Archangium lansingense TaxID=2995310 RepID=A0ABT4ACL8_9BACT|nr:hypothetical protein [Archangium lansinium]MCY1079425.1 hypothetical protein [Archangium lansinium]